MDIRHRSHVEPGILWMFGLTMFDHATHGVVGVGRSLNWFRSQESPLK